jgi:hypothetical protein
VTDIFQQAAEKLHKTLHDRACSVCSTIAKAVFPRPDEAAAGMTVRVVPACDCWGDAIRMGAMDGAEVATALKAWAHKRRALATDNPRFSEILNGEAAGLEAAAVSVNLGEIPVSREVFGILSMLEKQADEWWKEAMNCHEEDPFTRLQIRASRHVAAWAQAVILEGRHIGAWSYAASVVKDDGAPNADPVNQDPSRATVHK